MLIRWYRAPELLCDNSHYDAKIDVWSTALVYAELLLGKTLLPGRDYLDQLRRTVKLVGQPTEEEMSFLAHPAAKKAIRGMEYKGVPFKRLFCDQDPACIDLLRKMLKFNPEVRNSPTMRTNQNLKHQNCCATLFNENMSSKLTFLFMNELL